MNKKIPIIVFLVILSLFLSGCLYQSESLDIDSISSDNYIPNAIIVAPEIAYFGDYIEFDGTESYDSDGNIVLYYWLFGDGETSEGKKVKHTYEFENDLYIDYPLIYTASLLIMDNRGASIGISHEIKLYPKSYILYFRPDELAFEKPFRSLDKIKVSNKFINLNSQDYLTYKLNKSINISECSWAATIFLEKPYLTRITWVKIALYDSNNNEISKDEKNLGIFRFWNKKIINLEGKIEQNVEFQSVKLFIYGFSLYRRVNILYGDEKSSSIIFDFKD